MAGRLPRDSGRDVGGSLMIHPAILAVIPERTLTLLRQAEELIAAREIPQSARERWLGECREMIAYKDLPPEVETQLREAGVIE